MTKTFLAKIDGNSLVPIDGALGMPDEQLVRVTVSDDLSTSPNADRAGASDALLSALRRQPPIPREVLEEVERHIEEGKRPGDARGAFDEPKP